MKHLKNFLFFLFRTFVYREAFNSVRKRGVLLYLRLVQVVRRSLLAAILIFVTLQLMVFGLVGSIIAGVFLLPHDFETRLWILFGVFGAFFLIPLIGLLIVFSEKTWYKLSGAEKMVSELQR